MRVKYNLDSSWRFQYENMNKSAYSHSAAYLAAKAGGAAGAAAVDFDDTDWRVVNLPHDYGSEGAFRAENPISEGYRDRSFAWYRRSFCLPKEYEGKQVLVTFDGISVYAEIFFNGSLIAHSFSGSVPITVDLTDRAYFGDRANVIAVRVDGVSSEGWWYNGSGIYRHVKLYVKDPLHIAQDGLWIKPVCLDLDEGKWQVECEATVENSSHVDRRGALNYIIIDSENNAVAEGNTTVSCDAYSKSVVSVSIPISNPNLWNFDQPYLYTVVATLTEDDVQDVEQVRIGFRTFDADPDKGYFLNGKSIKLKGVCNHQDHAGVGIAVPDSIQYMRVRKLKEMGCNAYRCAHHLHAPEILDACDELGMLVMDENRKFESDPEHLAHYETMVRRDRNHPSVVIYSLFNEETLQGTPEGRKMFQRIRSHLLKMDDTRLFTGAMHGACPPINGAASVMDVIGLNYKIGERARIVHELFPNQPVFGSENNSSVTTRGCYRTDHDRHILNCYDEEIVPWGQRIRETWDFVRANEWFGGIFIWTGFDYLGEPAPFEWPSVGAQFGLIDRCGFPKDGFYQCKSCFDDKPMVWITPHWNWKRGEIVRVMIASNCEETELFLNGQSLGRKRSDCCAPAEWNVPFEAGVLRAVGYRNGVSVATAEQKTALKAANILMECSSDTIQNDGIDAIAVNVAIADNEGTILETDDRLIQFEIVGDGILLGVGNGDPNSHEDDHAMERRLYAGRAQLIVGSVLGGEQLSIRAKAEGLPIAELLIPICQAEPPLLLEPCSKRFIRDLTVSVETYSEKPDACMYIADHDMNSFEPLNISSTSFQPNIREGWKILRAKFETPNLQSENIRCVLGIDEVYADTLEVYMSGECVFKKENCRESVVVSFDAKPSTFYDVRILLRAFPGKGSGIRGNMNLQYRKDKKL